MYEARQYILSVPADIVSTYHDIDLQSDRTGMGQRQNAPCRGGV